MSLRGASSEKTPTIDRPSMVRHHRCNFVALPPPMASHRLALRNGLTYAYLTSGLFVRILLKGQS
jgi:hypothetical protein